MKPKNLHIIFGMVKDKEPAAILKQLPVNARYYFCQANIPRAKDASELAATALKYGLKGKIFKNVNDALMEAQFNYSQGDIIFIGGSTFIVAELNML
jgi:dihydrofolate synthase/folylpolyglutamate synthase